MPLLDGKYEILSERPLGGGATRFEATTPGGERVRVVWYDDLDPREELAFERYRRILKALARDGTAALLDVVARPGARYVAWREPAGDLAPARHPELEERLRREGLDPTRAVLRRDGRSVVLYDLPFAAAGAAALGPAAGTAGSAAGASAGGDPAGRRGVWRAWRTLQLSDGGVAWTITAALLLLAAGAYATAFATRANDRVVTVPEVVGSSVQAAAQRLLDLGLTVEPVAVAGEATVGEVLRTEPGAGTPLRPGRRVRVAYSVPLGHLAPATVPDLAGLDGADASLDRLAAAGLRLGHVSTVYDEAPAGRILAQSVPPGATIGRGQSVDVVLSAGPRPETTFLPDLVGLHVDDARYLATVAGLPADHVVVEPVPNDRLAEGTVVSQSLAPYQRVVRGEATLRLLVADTPSAPPDPVGLPSLAGLSERQARAMASGFDVQVRTVEDRSLPDGVVLQSLPVGARPGDGPLVLTVNVRPLPVPVPDVRADLRPPERRERPFAWIVEPGIGLQTAEVHATTLQGDETLVLRRQVRGGDRVEGSWPTTALGPVRFALTLNGEPYGGELLVP